MPGQEIETSAFLPCVSNSKENGTNSLPFYIKIYVYMVFKFDNQSAMCLTYSLL